MPTKKEKSKYTAAAFLPRHARQYVLHHLPAARQAHSAVPPVPPTGRAGVKFAIGCPWRSVAKGPEKRHLFTETTGSAQLVGGVAHD